MGHVQSARAFSSFSVDDLERAKQFYSEPSASTSPSDEEGLELRIAGGTPVFVYPSSSYTAPKHTVLDLPSVDDIEAAVDEIVAGASPWSSTTCRN